MACMCGDTHCGSCGLAQGNWQCPICGAWADDCCDHIDEDGKLRPEFEAQAKAIADEEQAAVDAYVKELQEDYLRGGRAGRLPASE